MKPWIFRTSSFGLVLSALPFVAGSNVASSQSNNVASPEIAPPAAVAPADATGMPAPPDAANKPLPANVNPTAPTADVVKLAQAGVNEDVMLAFVNNSGSAFNLGSQDVIYLNDLGVPDSVVKAMIQRDQALTAPAQPAPATSEAPAAPAQPPAEMASETPPPAPETPPAGMSPPPAEMQPPDAQPVDASDAAPSYGDFYNDLSPYGTWVDMPDYGWCWQPYAVSANAGWQPYCDRGCWYYSDCGWYWHSYYSWGSVAFHYGRWFQDPHRGWCWWPDRIWGPAWVSWRYNNSYCGWAALPPRVFFHSGIGLSAGISADLGLSAANYAFVPWGALGDSHLAAHRLPQTMAASVFNNTTVLNDIVSGRNNSVINRGFAPEQVARLTHREIPRIDLQDNHDGLGEYFSSDGHTLVVNSRPPVQPVAHAASQPSQAEIQAYGSVGAIQRSYAPTGNASQNSGSSRQIGEPLVIHGNYTTASAAASGWTPASPSHNVTYIGQSYAPPHNGSAYVTYSGGQPVSQPRYQAPAVQNIASQNSRYYSSQVYTPASSAPVPRYDNRSSYNSYAPSASYNQPARQEPAFNQPSRQEPAYSAPRQESAPRASQSSSSSGSGYSRGNGNNH